MVRTGKVRGQMWIVTHLFGVHSKSADKELVGVGDVHALGRDLGGADLVGGAEGLKLCKVHAAEHLSLGAELRECGQPMKCLGVSDDARVDCQLERSM